MNIRSFILVSLCILLVRLASASNEPVSAKDAEYIVMFRTYHPVVEHEHLIEQCLWPLKAQWQLTSRHNPAVRFPSDFALVRLEALVVSDALLLLRACVPVRSVFPQSSLQLKPLETIPSRSSRQVCQWSQVSMASPFSSNQRGDVWTSPATELGAESLWNQGYTGAGVKVAIFDTGIHEGHPHFKNIKERSDWTNENTLDDQVGHGTFVAGVISSKEECEGFAPDAELFIFRVFTKAQVSYTTWFLDAFNYALHLGVHVLNLSIGGTDFMDRPFIEKVLELSASNVLVISAIGNDGPLYGTLNNPADQLDVIGVGGIDTDETVAPFSSRGMTTWELPGGYGRMKPDVVTFSRNVVGSRLDSGCKTLTGTSVASPVVAGAVTLLSSIIPDSIRWQIINPASMKQALTKTADRIENANMFEQGAGRLNLESAAEYLRTYKPHVSILPSKVDFLDCPYAWPYCSQPMYATAMPTVINTTILNGLAVSGRLVEPPRWVSQVNGEHLVVSLTYSEVIWPWTGYMALTIRVPDSSANWGGIVSGTVYITVESPPAAGEVMPRRSSTQFELVVEVIPTPPREKRILWDQTHNLRYPPGYLPRDNLDIKTDLLDWNADHPHTNFKQMYDILRSNGFYIETTARDWSCFDASLYGTLFIVDPEDQFTIAEMQKLQQDILTRGLSVMIWADWFDPELIPKLEFFDENTHSQWTPATGGCNVPAINALLKPFGMAFGQTVFNGEISLGNHKATFSSGTSIISFPAGGRLLPFRLYDQSAEILRTKIFQSSTVVPVLGFIDAATAYGLTEPVETLRAGRIAIYGDSHCIDSSHMRIDCFWLLLSLLNYTMAGQIDETLFPDESILPHPFESTQLRPSHHRSEWFMKHSRFASEPPLECPMQFSQQPLDNGLPKPTVVTIVNNNNFNSSVKIRQWTVGPHQDVIMDWEGANRFKFLFIMIGLAALWFLSGRWRRRRRNIQDTIEV